MEIGVLSRENYGVFCSLLLPEVANALSAGEPVTALALTQDDVAVGALAGYLDHQHFQIQSLYVAPDYRRCGGGRMLLETLFHALDGYASGVEISFTVTKEEHKTLLPFLEVMGFEREPDYGETLYLTSLGAVTATPFFASSGNKTGTPFSELSVGTLSLMSKTALTAAAPIPEGGLRADTVDRECSIAYINGGKLDAYVVFDTSWPGGLTLSAVWSRSKDPAVLPKLLRSAVARVREKYPPETAIAVQAVNSASAALIQTLLPEAEVVSHTYYRSLNLWM